MHDDDGQEEKKMDDGRENVDSDDDDEEEEDKRSMNIMAPCLRWRPKIGRRKEGETAEGRERMKDCVSNSPEEEKEADKEECDMALGLDLEWRPAIQR